MDRCRHASQRCFQPDRSRLPNQLRASVAWHIRGPGGQRLYKPRGSLRPADSCQIPPAPEDAARFADHSLAVMKYFARGRARSKPERAQEEEIFVGPSWRSIVFVCHDVLCHYAALLIDSAAERPHPCLPKWLMRAAASFL